MDKRAGYNVVLPAFEGPLDLLLHLIDKHEVDIYDIPIAVVTEQYLSYLRAMDEFNMEIASDFLLMAATLMMIKSRLLLPKPPKTIETEPEEDPRQELVQKLLEYRQVKQATVEMQQLLQQRSHLFPRPAAEPHPIQRIWPEDLQAIELWRVFARLLEMSDELPAAVVAREEYSVQEKMQVLVDCVRQHNRLAFATWLRRSASKQELITNFLALLEVIKLGRVIIVQEAASEEIWILRATEKDDMYG